MTKIRHDVMLRLVKVLDVVMITLPFAACWVWYYAAKTPLDGTWQGHAVILGLYAVLFILLGKTYDAFWMSMQRVSELMYGQVLAAMATDGIFYIVICLMATKLCNLLPGIAAIAGQFVMAGIWSAVAHRWYYKAFPPQPTTVVYDVRRGMDVARFGSVFVQQNPTASTKSGDFGGNNPTSSNTVHESCTRFWSRPHFRGF